MICAAKLLSKTQNHRFTSKIATMVPWKKTKAVIKIFKIKHKFFFELETFQSYCGLLFIMILEVKSLNVKKKLTPPLWELSQGGGQVEIRKKDSYVLKRKKIGKMRVFEILSSNRYCESWIRCRKLIEDRDFMNTWMNCSLAWKWRCWNISHSHVCSISLL